MNNRIESSERNLETQENTFSVYTPTETLEKEIQKVKENQYKSFKRYSHLFTKHFDDDFNYWDMPYESAIYLDKRYFITTFLSFLFLKIEFFSTIILEPFELYSVTIPFYITSLIIDFTFNALLYSDEIVSQKYSNDGKLSYITSFLLGLISNFITYLIMKILRKLIHYSFAFIELKKEKKEENDYYRIVSHLLKIVYKKLIISFILEFIICCVCGYYLFIFCEIYKKSQISLLINYGFGLLISLIISFIVALIVSILRKISIKCKNKKLYYSIKMF
jgi:hypothetical protein